MYQNSNEENNYKYDFFDTARELFKKMSAILASFAVDICTMYSGLTN